VPPGNGCGCANGNDTAEDLVGDFHELLCFGWREMELLLCKQTNMLSSDGFWILPP
jgi:hypothetical protein